jgi:membrane-bound ClpP family serine protease
MSTNDNDLKERKFMQFKIYIIAVLFFVIGAILLVYDILMKEEFNTVALLSGLCFVFGSTLFFIKPLYVNILE